MRSGAEGHRLLYVPGVRWADVPGTDRRLAEHLSRHVPVLWVDPPESVLRVPGRRRLRLWWVDTPQPGVRVIHTVAPPGFTRRGVRVLARAVQELAIRASGGRSLATVLSDPGRRFPAAAAGRRLYFVTDDWIEGARMMGLQAGHISRTERSNARRADVVAAVSPDLATVLEERLPRDRVWVLPNGCEVRQEPTASRAAGPDGSGRRSGAILVGQLNERLDLEVLRALTGAGVPVVVVGPRTDRDPEFAQRLDAWLDSPQVRWLGRLDGDALTSALDGADLGLTPYAESAFNRSSFPLKTLEYLASGLPVVATDHPAARWLDTPFVQVARDPGEFARLTQAVLARPRRDLRTERRRFAAAHSWDARAESVLDALSIPDGRAG